LVAGYGLFTAAEFALMARRHMLTYGTTVEQLATVAATIRNNGHENPAAVYYGRGPFTPADILASRPVAEPFHLLDCAMTSEGGCGLVFTTAERAADRPNRPAFILGGGCDSFGAAYQVAPVWDMRGRPGDVTVDAGRGCRGRPVLERRVGGAVHGRHAGRERTAVSTLEPQPAGAIPVPRPSRLSQPYWEGCAAGELRFQRCRDCGAVVF